MTESTAAYGDISLQISRLMHAACCRSHAELAELLEIPYASISEALLRERIPRTWESPMLHLGINPEYVLNGTLPKYLRPYAAVCAAPVPATAAAPAGPAPDTILSGAPAPPTVSPDNGEPKPEALTLRHLLRCFSKEDLQRELGRRSKRPDSSPTLSLP